MICFATRRQRRVWAVAKRGRSASCQAVHAALLVAAVLAPHVAPAQDGPFVYVPNTESDNVSRIDIPTNTVQAGTITVGIGPGMAAVRGDQSLVYVTNFNSNTVSVIDTATNTVLTTINVGTGAQGVAVSPDGTRVYVTNQLSNTVSVIDTATNTVLTTVHVGTTPVGVAVSADGTHAYVTNLSSNTVSVIDTATNMVLTTVTVGNGPFDVAVSADGTRAYVTNSSSNTVSVIDTATNTVLTTVPVGNGPGGVAVSPDGTRAYVTNFISNTVSVIDTATNTVLTTVNVGNTPFGVAVSPDGTRAYVPNIGTDNVSVIDTATNMVLTTVTVGNGPRRPGICGNGNALLAAGRTFTVKQSGAIACTGAGGPVFTGGTMQIAAANIASALPITLAAQGGTIDTQGNTATFTGAISGPGGLTKTGSGTLIVSGTSSYLGATAVNQGTLQSGAANAFSPFSAFNVVAGATIDLNSFDQTVGSLAGAGNVLLGAATLTAGGDNSSTTFSGAIAGSGGLVKNGTGAFTLSGANAYLGPTTINEGTLVVNGSIVSPTSVNAGGTLAGTGTIFNNVTINSGGTLAPGSGAPGSSMTVAGNLGFAPGAFYLVQVDPSTASSTMVTAGGSAALSGTVNAVFQPGSYVANNYTILSTAGGLGGSTFGGLAATNLPPGFLASLSYTGNDVILNLLGALGTSGLSRNQQNVANAINDFFNSGGTLPPGFVTVFGLTGPALATALTQLSGEHATGIQRASDLSTSLFLNAMLDPFVSGRAAGFGPWIGYAPETAASRAQAVAQDALAAALPVKAPPSAPGLGQRWSVWGAAYGGRNRTDGDPVVVGNNDLTARAAGFAAGADYRVSPESVIGAAVAIGETDWTVSGLGKGNADLAQVGGYASTRWDNLYLSGAAALAWHRASTDRTVTIAGTDRLEADFNATSFGGRIEGGYRFGGASFGLTPYAAAQIQGIHTPAYSEAATSGSNQFALSYVSQSTNDVRSELGFWADARHALANGALVILRGRAAWVHDFDPDSRIQAAFQTLPGASFVVDGAAAPRDAALTSAVAELRMASGASLIGKFDGEFARGSHTISGTATVRYAW